MTVYTENGYANRAEYLDELRESYGELVDILITVLPAEEDFDGLVTELEDAFQAGYLEGLEA
jgi:vacuolar-type H+-ATPase subunit D/Vma8